MNRAMTDDEKDKILEGMYLSIRTVKHIYYENPERRLGKEIKWDNNDVHSTLIVTKNWFARHGFPFGVKAVLRVSFPNGKELVGIGKDVDYAIGSIYNQALTLEDKNEFF